MNDPKKPFFDLSEEASKRSDEKATSIARQLESDDINEETNSGIVNGPNEDAENRVWTSSSDE